MKCYPLIISEHFPSAHPRFGQKTNFNYKLQHNKKLHTIRKNYDFWKPRIDKINQGLAFLSIRIWEGKPYRSKQKEIKLLSNLGIEMVGFNRDEAVINENPNKVIDIKTLAYNDGLTKDDFLDWFNIRNKHFEGCIIHFTGFRYDK